MTQFVSSKPFKVTIARGGGRSLSFESSSPLEAFDGLIIKQHLKVSKKQ